MGRVRDGLLVVVAATLLVISARWEWLASLLGPGGMVLRDGGAHRLGLPALTGLSLGVCLPWLLRRRLPLTAATLSTGVALLGATVPTWQGRLVALAMWGAAAYHRPLRPALLLAVVLGWALLLGYFIGLVRMTPLSAAADLVIVSLAPLATGYALRLHRQRAEQAVRLYRAEADRTMAEERARLARDVHDSVGHHLTAIRMQAAAARRVLGGAPPVADRALGTIADLSAAALGEVRELLRTLRKEPGRARPGLEELESLIRQVSGPGRQVSLRRCGGAAPLPPIVDHTAYRVVQEALTNAARHSEATEVEVRVRQDRERLVIVVADNGPACPEPGPVAEGQGLRGMRERVRQLGGSLSAGPRRPHGWLVEAELPVERGTG